MEGKGRRKGKKRKKGVRGVRRKKGKKGCVMAFDGNGRPCCERQRCSQRSMVSSDIRFMPIFVGVHRW